MTFDEVLDQVRELLQQRGRVTYRSLKRRFELDDEYVEDLKGELIRAEGVAADEDGEVLVWTGGTTKGETVKGGKGETEKPPTSSDARPKTLDARPTDGERRQLTVQFIDLVGSTALSTHLDPEELREVIQAYRDTCATVIRRFEGYLAKYIGDGLLVYFGYPLAHEDDAQRAVRAGLGILAALPQLNVRLRSTLEAHSCAPLQVRIGIHTGLVVAGEMGVGDQPEHLGIVGETPNIAARLQEKAAPNSVVLSPTTSRLVSGLFECQDLGPQTLKGLDTPLVVYRVMQESAAQSRFEVAVRTGLTPLVGRDEELGLLLRHWEQAKEGEGQVVLINGEGGIGKSRLVQELKDRVAREEYRRIEFRCSPYYQNTAFYPVIDHIQRLLQFRRDDTPEKKLDKLETVLREYRLPLQDVVPLFAALLSLPPPEHYPPVNLSPQKQKQKTQEALVAWLLAEAERKAVLTAWEDLHWADPSTLELLGLFIDQAPTVRILTLLTFRPEFSPPWGSRSHLTQLTLNHLGRKQVERMVKELTGGTVLPAEVLQQIVTKTDGVPLFVEELTKMVVESGLLREKEGHYELVGSLPPLAIPATLQDSLIARLDRLATVREVAQLGATLGREFTYELIQAVSPVDDGTLQKELTQLVEAELLYQRGLPPQTRYIFKHALLQDAAYQSLLKSKRQQYHQQIAQVLEERFSETVETQPELLAHHYTEADLAGQAIPYWQKAGQRAIERSANVEAVRHLTKGLELLKALPDALERTQQELALQTALGAPLIATKGYGALEVERAYARALELCRQVGETPQLFPVLWGLSAFYLVRAEHRTARELGEQLLRLAQSVQDSALLVEAHHALGQALYFLGEFTLAQEQFEQGMAVYNPQQHGSLGFLYGQDPGMACLSYESWALWPLGYPDQALKRSDEALTLAQELAHPVSLAFALDFTAMLYQYRRAGQTAQERAEAAIRLCSEQEFAFWLAMGTILQGGALAAQGQGEAGISQLRQGLVAWRATGAEIARSCWLALLAEAYEKTGQIEEGLTVLAEALTQIDKSEERFWEAELYRLKGELTLQKEARGWRLETGPSSSQASSLKPQASQEVEQEAEGYFLKAIDIARRQQAKSLELRATVSLARLWQQQGKHHAAHNMLSEIYGWFTEGFDTKDLQDAKALLDELSEGGR